MVSGKELSISQPKWKEVISKIRAPGKVTWIIAIILLLAIAGGYAYYSKVVLPARVANGTSPQTEVVRRGDLVLSASGTGTLVAQTDATFGFETSGQVTQVHVKIGDQVEAGDILAQLDDTLAQMDYVEAKQALTEIYSAREIATVQQEISTAEDAEFYAHEWLKYLLSPEVVEAEENLAIAEQKLADAQAEAKTNPSEEANQIVATREDAISYLKDKLTQAQTYYQDYYLPENFGEYENIGSRRYPKQVLVTYIDPDTGEVLPEIDEPSIDDIAKARNNYIQAQQTVKDGETYLEVLNTGVIPEGATGEKLNDLYQAQLALTNAEAALKATKLIAPISGTVTSLALSVGQQVDAAASSIITISQLSQPYTLDAYLDESDWSMAQIGNKVTVTFNLLPEQTFPGTVTLVYPELNASSRVLAGAYRRAVGSKRQPGSARRYRSNPGSGRRRGARRGACSRWRDP